MSKFMIVKQALQDNGWTVQELPLASDCWWAKAIWQLTSQWSPFGHVIYLTLLLDPMSEFDANSPPDASVWAVDLFAEVPQDRPMVGISAKRNLSQVTKEIVNLAASMRMAK